MTHSLPRCPGPRRLPGYPRLGEGPEARALLLALLGPLPFARAVRAAPPDTGDTGAPAGVLPEEALALVRAALEGRGCDLDVLPAEVVLDGGAPLAAEAATCPGGAAIRFGIADSDAAMATFAADPAAWVAQMGCALAEDEGGCRAATCGPDRPSPADGGLCGAYAELPAGALPDAATDPGSLYAIAVDALLVGWGAEPDPVALAGCGCEVAPPEVAALPVLLAVLVARWRRAGPLLR